MQEEASRSVAAEPSRGVLWGRANQDLVVALLAVTALGFGVRFAALQAAGVPQPIGDEFYYVEVASQIAAGAGHVSTSFGTVAGWPPGYPFALSLFIPQATARAGRSHPANWAACQRAQLIFSTGLVLAIALLGVSLFGRRTGVAAGVLAGLYPTLVAYGHYFWSETLFTLVATFAWVALLEARRRNATALAALAGLLFGFSALVREIGLLLAGSSAIWWSVLRVRERGAPRRGWLAACSKPALMLGLALLVVLPWTWRNYREIGRLAPVSIVGWMALREGNTLADPDWMRPDTHELSAFRRTYLWELKKDADRIDMARRETLALIWKEQPLWLLKKLVRNVNLLFSPDSFVFKKISMGKYGRIEPLRRRLTVAFTLLGYALVLGAALAGLAADPRSERRGFSLLAIGAVVALHVVANASSRYRVPLLPLFVTYAAWALLHPRELGTRLRGRRLLGPALALAFFALVCVPYFAPDAASLWSRGTYADAGG